MGVETLSVKQGIDSTLFFYAQTKRITHNNNKLKLTEMKKVFIIALMLFCGIANAQNYLSMNITEIQQQQVFEFCSNSYDSIVFTKEASCNNQVAWGVRDWVTQQIIHEAVDELTLVPNQMNLTPNSQNIFEIIYHADGCNIVHRVFNVIFNDSSINESWTQDYVWKRTGTSTTLSATWGENLFYQWSTGETYQNITVTDPGTYWVRIYNDCGELYDTIEVRDNVEIYRSGVDPATNKNRVLWQTTSEQAAYISNVKVERDGMVVGTVPYTDGQFLDNIGSENAARIYKITAIDTDGNECPIPSYQFGTFNTIISPDIANPSLMNFTWEDPFIEEGLPYSIVAYRIGRFNESTGEFVAIDQLSAQVHLGKYNMDLFEGDYGIVAAVFSDAKNRDYEELAFSNRSDSGIVGIGEQDNETFGIYPNPAKGRFTVEGSGTMTVTNTLGQTILTREIDGKETVELPQGLYFVKLGEATRKVVVE